MNQKSILISSILLFISFLIIDSPITAKMAKSTATKEKKAVTKKKLSKQKEKQLKKKLTLPKKPDLIISHMEVVSSDHYYDPERKKSTTLYEDRCIWIRPWIKNKGKADATLLHSNKAWKIIESPDKPDWVGLGCRTRVNRTRGHGGLLYGPGVNSRFLKLEPTRKPYRYKIKIKIDPDNRVEESNENNNIKTIYLQVRSKTIRKRHE